MLTNAALAGLAETLRKSRGIAAKADIAAVAAALDLSGSDAIAVGDDCAAIPEGDGYTLFAIEGFMNEFVAADPWFAGWCGAMVNISDVAAMGGRPTAIVNAIWSNGADKAAPILEGLKAAARTFGVPVIGGHTNVRSSQSQFAVAILGRASRLLTSFDARPGDKLIAAIDLRGHYRDPFANWEAATDAPAERLRGDLEILPSIAEAGLALAAKDISQGGIVGTAAMLAECSQVAITLDVEAVPIPAGAPLERWLLTFPSFGYLLSAKPDDVDEILSLFQRRGIAAAAIGDVSAGTSVDISAGSRRATVWDFAAQPLIGCAPGQGYRQRSVA
ncbi:sll0787 family AIR synthase-like protein [Bradyrhizobium guangzhouense]|uniref:sll0787 family AIR synthase-like protein n=1 Tax=Bradyrhizobium guangzhouense TaxID=1325095 RepID=UPI001009FE66|nr:sll0787 family AIR synthase-like protein [Bradyrhizobium guangzhouense]RXH18431.1 sll0787 family AIR synthase-like protein [Bradyrhizobium guangzhouense]